MKNIEKKQLYIILLFFLISLVIKSTGLYEISKLDYCNLYMQPNDSFFNIRSAEEFINPHINEKIDNFVPTTFYKPFLKAIFYFFGMNLSLIRIFQLFLSSLMIIILFLIGKNIHNKFLGIILMFLWTFNPDVTLYDLQILKYSLNFSFTLLTIYLLHIYKKNHSLFNLALSLISILILSSFRPIYYFLLIYIFKLRFENTPNAPLKRYLNLAFLILIPLFALGWLTFASGKSKTHVGIHMYKGFNPTSKGFYNSTPFIRDNSIGHMQEAVTISKNLSSKFDRYNFIDNFWLQKSFAFITDNPLKTFILIISKSVNLLFYNNWDDTIDIINLKKNISVFKILFLKFNLLMPFTLIGFFLSLKLRDKRPLLEFINILFFLQFASVILTCLSKRYQAQLTPVLIIYSGIGIYYSLKNIKLKKALFLSSFLILVYFSSYWFNKNIKDLKIPGRTAYHEIRIQDYKDAMSLFKPWSEGKKIITFFELKLIHEKFMASLSTIDAKRAIKKWLFENPNADLNEKEWCLESLGDSNLQAKQYHDALLNYQKAYLINKNENLQKKIETAKNFIFLVTNPLNYK